MGAQFTNTTPFRIWFGLDSRKKTVSSALVTNFHKKKPRDNGSSKNSLLVGHMSKCWTSLKRFSSLATSAKASSAIIDQSKEGNEVTNAITNSRAMEFNRVDCVLWVLHESARSFSQEVESLGLARTGPELAMAWIGRDVNEWHRRIAYRVAVYVLLKTAIDVEILLSHDRQNESSPVLEILTPLKDRLGEPIESQLKKMHPDLVEWLRAIEMPRIAGYFDPLLKMWSMEYAGSGVAGTIVAITCCTAVVKLRSGYLSCPVLILYLEDVLVKLMDSSLKHTSLDKLHQLATEAGFESDFFSHFGKKILPSEQMEDLEFWIGLAHKKLSKAFREESIISGEQNLHYKIQSDSLATLGLFAYLGRKTRIFLSEMGIRDLDEMVKDLISYLECGSLFIYPEFSSIPVYQLFMEVVTDEIGWLDFYTSYIQINCQEKRFKSHAIQAEKEIILSAVFTVCYDVFSGFAHFNRSTQQPLDTALLSYLLRSQSLLSVCMQYHWAAFENSGESLNSVDHAASDNPTSSLGRIPKFPLAFEAQQSLDLAMDVSPKSIPQKRAMLEKVPKTAGQDRSTFSKAIIISINKLSPMHRSFIKRYSSKFASASTDFWMGTSLLFIDIVIASELLIRQAKGSKASRRQKKRLQRTMTDIITLVPITVLMLLPVTAVGHAAMLAAIKRYMPCMIPSPYTPDRLDVVKQLKRTREMDNQSKGILEDASYTIS